ncbi:recombinase [Clostridium beijerinckii]|nr:recombinase [Clostridium beijerinckii]
MLTEFDDKIFNALVDRIDILELTYFAFVLKNKIRSGF